MPLSAFLPRAAAALAVIAWAAGPILADVVILKDGYTLHGIMLFKEKIPIQDGDDVFVMEKPNGATFLDDGARWTVFSATPRQVADVSDANKFKDLTAYSPKEPRYAGGEKFPISVRDPKISPWDERKWMREIVFTDGDNKRVKHTLKQQITIISPYYVRIGSSSHRMTTFFLTKEFQPGRIRSFLLNHPDLAETPVKPAPAIVVGLVALGGGGGVGFAPLTPDPEKRERLIRFWIQADWLDEADADLDQLIKALPTEKTRHARLKSEVNGLRAEKLMAEVEHAKEAGRHQWAIRTLNSFPKEDLPKAVAEKLTTLRAEYEIRSAKFDAARRQLAELPRLIQSPSNRFLAEAASAVRAELHMDTMARIEIFTTLAERAELDAKNGRKAAQSPEELLAAAITGWHLGKVSAETKVESARRCWTTRLAALEYLRTTNKRERAALLDNYLKSADALAYDELEKLVSLLPPPDAPAEVPTMAVHEKLAATTSLPTGAEYVLRLPAEYQPGRPYPLLIVLPDSFETPEEVLAKFGEQTANLGYIVAAPKWKDPLKDRYGYSREEHAIVTNLLRHLRRAYQVDSDRVFLFGNGEGGAMALDIGASHPDLFAGIVPVNPTVRQPLYVPCEYWMNFERLPVYMVLGDRSGPSVAAIRLMSERWMPHGYPALIVSYKGRGRDWFPEELPYMFDWMSRKKRSEPGRTLGPPATTTTPVEGFRSVRFTDNRFFWLSSDQMNPGSMIAEDFGLREGVQTPTPAKFAGKIVEGNQINVRALGMKEVTVWFGKGMLDYDKPVRLKVGDRKLVTKTVKPQIGVLLEDLFDRADRQRPYFEKAEFRLQ